MMLANFFITTTNDLSSADRFLVNAAIFRTLRYSRLIFEEGWTRIMVFSFSFAGPPDFTSPIRPVDSAAVSAAAPSAPVDAAAAISSVTATVATASSTVSAVAAASAASAVAPFVAVSRRCCIPQVKR